MYTLVSWLLCHDYDVFTRRSVVMERTACGYECALHISENVFYPSSCRLLTFFDLYCCWPIWAQFRCNKAIEDSRLRPRANEWNVTEIICRHTYDLVFDMAHHMKTWRYPQNWKCITYCIVVRGGPSHVYRKFCEVWTCRFWDRRADRQTRWSQYLAPLPGAK